MWPVGVSLFESSLLSTLYFPHKLAMSFLGDSDSGSGSGSEGEGVKTHSSSILGRGSRKSDDGKLRVNEKFAKK